MDRVPGVCYFATMPPTRKTWPPELTAAFEELVGPRQRAPGEPVGLIKLFVSHDHADAAIAEALVDFIQGRVKIPNAAIRCTSLDRCQLPNGADPDRQLPSELRTAAMVIGIVTETSRESDWVLFELGARWGQNVHLAAVLLPGASYDTLPKPIRGRIAAHLDDRKRMIRLAQEVAEGTGYAFEDDHLKSDEAIETFMKFAQSLPRTAETAATGHSSKAKVEEKTALTETEAGNLGDMIASRVEHEQTPLASLVTYVSKLRPTHDVFRVAMSRGEQLVRDTLRSASGSTRDRRERYVVGVLARLADVLSEILRTERGCARDALERSTRHLFVMRRDMGKVVDDEFMWHGWMLGKVWSQTLGDECRKPLLQLTVEFADIPHSSLAATIEKHGAIKHPPE